MNSILYYIDQTISGEKNYTGQERGSLMFVYVP